MAPHVMTTAAAAKVAGVSLQTMIRWVDGGRVPGFRIPGSTHRRVVRDGLFKFLLDHGMPVGESDGPSR
jgi:excisionase family DNA binding protein